ncbi:MAG: hypothetical protein ACTSUE_17580 [Promethearchaeota archaeon]
MEKQRVRKKAEEAKEKEVERISDTVEIPVVARSRLVELEEMKEKLALVLKELEIPDAYLEFLEYIGDVGEDDLVDGGNVEYGTTEKDVVDAGGTVSIVQKIELSEKEKLLLDLVDIHDWLDDIRYEFMFSEPMGKKEKDADYKEWLEEWSKVLFDYATISRKHIVYIQELLNIEPFSKLRNRRDIVLKICLHMIKKELAEWLIKKEKLRVYWKTLDEWAQVIYKWAYDDMRTDPLFIFDFKEEGEEFSDLPDEDFAKIFKILEKQKKGRIVKSSDKKIAFLFEF